MKSSQDFPDPLCKLAHDLTNKLAVILGCCELLGDEVEPSSECANRLAIIRKAVEDMTREIRLRACRPTEEETAQITSRIREFAKRRGMTQSGENSSQSPPSGG